MNIPENLKRIFEPREVAVAPHYADRAMMITKEGQIRCYGARMFEHEDGRKEASLIVMKSDDCGLSFREDEVTADDAGASTCSPWSGDYLTMIEFHGKQGGSWVSIEAEIRAARQLREHEHGTFVLRSSNGPDGPWEETKISDEVVHLQRLPLPLKKQGHWINAGQKKVDGYFHPVVFLSDNDGRTWSEKILPAPPNFTVHYPHKGMRWFDPGVEPAFAETATGRIIMLLRTSVDVHYQCHSDDGGKTWSEMIPSPFFSVATMPGIYTLSDGRLIAVWNNTTPLPELDHDTQTNLNKGERNGFGEDVFTNRDALHAAVSHDNGETWHGFREIALNPLRCSEDFRTAGGIYELLDKSVHQNQLLELPGGKVLVHYGQHRVCSRLIIFDPDFLDVTERTGTFEHGLRDWSTQIYYKSISGNIRIAGHCAWNRRSGATLMPSPDNEWLEALLIGRHPDKRLFSELEGADWNFPAARRGTVSLDLTIMPGSGGIRISLADRWINPCDGFVKEWAVFSFVLDGNGAVDGVKLAEAGKRFTLELDFDLDVRKLIASVEDASYTLPVTQTLKAPFGEAVELSYLHLQTAAEKADEDGVFLHGTKMAAKC